MRGLYVMVVIAGSAVLLVAIVTGIAYRAAKRAVHRVTRNGSGSRSA